MDHPKVGVAVVISIGRDDSFHLLMGKRLKPFGFGQYAFPGGHLETYETPDLCARREVLEETGLDLSSVDGIPLGYTNDIQDGFHYITLYIHFHLDDEIPEDDEGWIFPKVINTEPTKCEGWDWISTYEHFYNIPIWSPITQMFKDHEDHFGRYTDLYVD